MNEPLNYQILVEMAIQKIIPNMILPGYESEAGELLYWVGWCTMDAEDKVLFERSEGAKKLAQLLKDE